MTAITFLAAAEAEPGRLETFLSGFPHLLGVLVVIATLTVLWGLCALTGKIVQRLLPGLTAPEAVPVPVVVPAVAAPAMSPEMVAAIAAVTYDRQASAVPSEIVAVIAAAVHSAVGKDSRVVAIRPSDSNWEKAGRQAVFGSHRFRK
jgi:Na+-transporting methylmalonyl-CoA/oxaloacetate decarboxylase gamma subunit